MLLPIFPIYQEVPSKSGCILQSATLIWEKNREGKEQATKSNMITITKFQLNVNVNPQE